MEAPDKTIEIENYPTPMSKPVDNKEVHFQLKHGRVAYVPLNEFIAKWKTVIEEKLWKLKDSDEFTETIGPMDGFTIRYTVMKEEIPFDGSVGQAGARARRARSCRVFAQLGRTGRAGARSAGQQIGLSRPVGRSEPASNDRDRVGLCRQLRPVPLHPQGAVQAGLHGGRASVVRLDERRRIAARQQERGRVKRGRNAAWRMAQPRATTCGGFRATVRHATAPGRRSVGTAAFAPEDWEALFLVASDPLLWEQHPAHDRYQEAVFQEFFRKSLASGGALVAVDRKTHKIVGSSRCSAEDTRSDEIHIGWTFLARSHWGGAYNAEMKRLMLGHAFQFVDSVIFLVAAANGRSRRAVEKIGGVLTDRQVTKNLGGEAVDHVVYRIKKPAVA